MTHEKSRPTGRRIPARNLLVVEAARPTLGPLPRIVTLEGSDRKMLQESLNP